MKAVVFHKVGDIRLEDVPEPKLKKPTDAIVRLTASAICGTDLHALRGTMTGMKAGTVLGHEGVGVVEALGADVRNFSLGDRVVITSTIACGNCVYCRAGEFAMCDESNPNGPQAGTAFFGSPEDCGAFDGMQAEKVRVPFAHVNLVKLPHGITDDQAILLSDVFPTGYMGAVNAEIKPGNVVAVFGCGPVGLFAILSARLLGAGRVIAVDRIADRLEKARELGAETVDFGAEDPVKTIHRMTGGIGPDRVIDAVGVDSDGGPSKTLEWAVECVAKAGTLSVIGVYPESVRTFPIGDAMNKNLTIKLGNCNHRRYVEQLIELVQEGAVDPLKILTQRRPLASAIEAYTAFDDRALGWIKVELDPTLSADVATAPAGARGRAVRRRPARRGHVRRAVALRRGPGKRARARRRASRLL